MLSETSAASSQKDLRGGIVGIQEILHDYTTLYCHLAETSSGKEFFRLIDTPTLQDEIRMINSDHMIGKMIFMELPAWLKNTLLEKALYGYLEPGKVCFTLYYLKRV